MSRPRYAVIPLLFAVLLSGCGTPSDRAPEPESVAVVEDASPPEPSAPPEPTCSAGEPKEVPKAQATPVKRGSYRDGSTYEC